MSCLKSDRGCDYRKIICERGNMQACTFKLQLKLEHKNCFFQAKSLSFNAWNLSDAANQAL